MGMGNRGGKGIIETQTKHAGWDVHDNVQSIWSFSTDDAT